MANEDQQPTYADSGSPDEDVLADARKFYEDTDIANSDNRDAALDDLRFLAGDHWPAKTKQQRSLDGRPCLTINTLPTYVHQVTNDQRQNKPGIKVHPVDDNADEETAKVFQGLIRHVEYDSNADVAYDTAVNHAAAIGFGYWRWIPEYEDDTSFNQVLRFKRIRNPLSVRFDPLSTEPDGSDAKRVIIESRMSKKEFEKEWPDAKANTWTLAGDGAYPSWISQDEVLVCEFYRIEREKATVCLLSDGSSGFKQDLAKPLPAGVTIVKERESWRSKVMWYKLTATDILEKTEILCKWIPVFPCYGDELDIDGKVIRSGLVRNAKDPAMMYDFFMTSATEEVSLRPKAPFIGAVGQFETAKEDWVQANNRSFAFLEYDPVTADGTMAPPPQRQQMADVPSGMLAMAMHASDNVKKTTGLFDASLGARGTATSGIQEAAQQRQGDVANFHYTDNLMRSIRHCGRTLVYSIPKYYDAERTVRILGDDDSADYATINQPNLEGKKNALGEVQAVLNNLGAGTYDVTISTGPGFATLRQEAAQNMAANLDKNPELWGVFGDLYVKAQDWPGAEEIAERVRKTIPPQLLEQENEDDEIIQTPKGPLPISQVPQAIAGMEQYIQQLEQQLQGQQAEAQTVQEEKANVTAQKAALDAQQKVMKADFDRMGADIARMKAELKAEVTEQDAHDQRVLSEVEAKFAELTNTMREMVTESQKADMVQDAQQTPEQDAAQDAANNQALLAALEMMRNEANAIMQAALATIAEARQPKTIQITGPSGQVYTGISQ